MTSNPLSKETQYLKEDKITQVENTLEEFYRDKGNATTIKNILKYVSLCIFMDENMYMKEQFVKEVFDLIDASSRLRELKTLFGINEDKRKVYVTYISPFLREQCQRNTKNIIGMEEQKSKVYNKNRNNVFRRLLEETSPSKLVRMQIMGEVARAKLQNSDIALLYSPMSDKNIISMINKECESMGAHIQHIEKPEGAFGMIRLDKK